MKKALLLLSTLIISSASFAQSNWSIGLRTGFEPIKYSSLESSKTNIRYQEQFFITRRIIKRLEIELNTSYILPITISSTQKNTFDGPDYYSTSTTTRSIYVGASLKYFIVQKQWMDVYAFAEVDATRNFGHSEAYNSAYYGAGGFIPEGQTSFKGSETKIPDIYAGGFGINKRIQKHFVINAQMGISCCYSGSIFSYSNSFTPKLQMGLAYTL